MREVLNWIKMLPIIINMYILVLIGTFYLFSLKEDRLFTYCLFGHSLIFDVFLLYCGYKASLCLWHKLLSINLIIIMFMEWSCDIFNIGTLSIIIFNIATVNTILALFYTLIQKLRKDDYKREIHEFEVSYSRTSQNY
jgi:hypothetical protein